MLLWPGDWELRSHGVSLRALLCSALLPQSHPHDASGRRVHHAAASLERRFLLGNNKCAQKTRTRAVPLLAVALELGASLLTPRAFGFARLAASFLLRHRFVQPVAHALCLFVVVVGVDRGSADRGGLRADLRPVHFELVRIRRLAQRRAILRFRGVACVRQGDRGVPWAAAACKEKRAGGGGGRCRCSSKRSLGDVCVGVFLQLAVMRLNASISALRLRSSLSSQICSAINFKKLQN